MKFRLLPIAAVLASLLAIFNLARGEEGSFSYWIPSIAPSGRVFYTGETFPKWRGDLFIGALASTHLAHLELQDREVVAERRLLDERGWRIRAVATGPEGNLYLLTDADNGRLVRLSPRQQTAGH